MSADDFISRLDASLSGRYRIVREVGGGGMATVYLADDVRHERKVALKVLKPELAAVVGADRFLAEIRTTANLQHPHILPLHDSGEADGFLYYVMPYVEGESLRERLERDKQLPVDEAVRIATDVAEALHAAHEQGVVHRDVKPANILLSRGRPLVADFGIALAVSAAGGGRLTETGLSVGTPYYMSPEQAAADRDPSAASDVYSLGCVLYEMLVGDPPHAGSSAQAVLAKILTEDVRSAASLRASIPANVDATIRKALEKLPADRFTGALGFANALADPAFRHGKGGAAGDAPRAGSRWNALTVGFASISAILAVALLWSLLRPTGPYLVARFSSPFEEGQRPTGYMEFTPDGSALVYRGAGPDGVQLWLRRWSDLAATPIRGTEGAIDFDLSPDGREVAFSRRPGPLRVLPLDGGPGRTLVEQVLTVDHWSDQGMVYFQGVEGPGVRRVPGSGGGDGAVEIVTELTGRETGHGSFETLPGGRTAVFQVYYAQNAADAEVWAIDLATFERRFLTVGQSPRYAPTGHLLFGLPDGTLMAAPFDPRRAELTGPAAQVAYGLARGANFGTMNYTVSRTGALIYEAGSAQRSPADTELVWVSRTGDPTPVDPGGWIFNRGGSSYGWRLSPDGTRIALTSAVDGNSDIWIKQLPDGPVERLTFDDTDELHPAWSPDGAHVTYSKYEGGVDFDLWRGRADGVGVPERLVDDEQMLLQARWGAEGEWLLLRAVRREGQVITSDITAFQPAVDGLLTPLVATPGSSASDPALSPDGRWLAYTSDETGRNEVFVRPFDGGDAEVLRISTEGGVGPLWAHSGRELFFVDADRGMIAVEVETQPALQVVRRRTLFTVPPGYYVDVGQDFYDISTDDQRFLMARSFFFSEEGNRIILVQHFLEEVERLAPN